MAQAKFTKTFNAFSGVDMIVTFAGRWIGELQGVSYSVTREKAPIYTMGDANPRAFSRGKRGIAGALVFALFDKSALIEELKNLTNPISADTGAPGGAGANEQGLFFNNGLNHYRKEVGGSPDDLDISSLKLEPSENIYFDQILPFNIVVNGGNEYGSQTSMEIRGIELLNNGAGMSIDDIQINETCSFLARDVRNWKTIPSIGIGRVGDSI